MNRDPFTSTLPMPGNIGFMSQSGALGEAILAIAARNRRSGVRGALPETLTHDTLRRPIVGPGLDVLKTARRIAVGVDGQGRKTYAATGEVRR